MYEFDTVAHWSDIIIAHREGLITLCFQVKSINQLGSNWYIPCNVPSWGEGYNLPSYVGSKLWQICINVVPLKVSPKDPFLAYAGTNPENQSLVTIIDGIILRSHNNWRHALAKHAISRIVSPAPKSG